MKPVLVRTKPIDPEERKRTELVLRAEINHFDKSLVDSAIVKLRYSDEYDEGLVDPDYKEVVVLDKADIETTVTGLSATTDYWYEAEVVGVSYFDNTSMGNALENNVFVDFLLDKDEELEKVFTSRDNLKRFVDNEELTAKTISNETFMEAIIDDDALKESFDIKPLGEFSEHGSSSWDYYVEDNMIYMECASYSSTGDYVEWKLDINLDWSNYSTLTLHYDNPNGGGHDELHVLLGGETVYAGSDSNSGEFPIDVSGVDSTGPIQVRFYADGSAIGGMSITVGDVLNLE